MKLIADNDLELIRYYADQFSELARYSETLDVYIASEELQTLLNRIENESVNNGSKNDINMSLQIGVTTNERNSTDNTSINDLISSCRIGHRIRKVRKARNGADDHGEFND